MNIEILNVRFNDLARMLLADTMEDVRYCIATEKTDNKELAKRTLTKLLPEYEKKNFEIEIRHDSSGAPFAEFYDSGSLVQETISMISLTDEMGISSCFALIKKKSCKNIKEIVGVGIDLANIEELSGILHISKKRLARFLGETEMDNFSKLSKEKAAIYIAEQFSKREAAFKSMSSIYDLYREKNQGKSLPVSFMDFKFSAEGNTIVQRMTSDFYKKEAIDIHVETFQHEGNIGAVAVCWKVNPNINI